MNDDNNSNQDGNQEKNSRQSRRDFVKLAGKVAVYTPPAMMGLAAPSVHAISKSAIGNHALTGRSTADRRRRRMTLFRRFRHWLRRQNHGRSAG
jgi:hypothetical protein